MFIERQRRALAEAAADGAVSKILPGESVGEQSVLDEAANLADIGALEDSELRVSRPHSTINRTRRGTLS